MRSRALGLGVSSWRRSAGSGAWAWRPGADESTQSRPKGALRTEPPESHPGAGDRKSPRQLHSPPSAGEFSSASPTELTGATERLLQCCVPAWLPPFSTPGVQAKGFSQSGVLGRRDNGQVLTHSFAQGNGNVLEKIQTWQCSGLSLPCLDSREENSQECWVQSPVSLLRNTQRRGGGRDKKRTGWLQVSQRGAQRSASHRFRHTAAWRWVHTGSTSSSPAAQGVAMPPKKHVSKEEKTKLSHAWLGPLRRHCRRAQTSRNRLH